MASINRKIEQQNRCRFLDRGPVIGRDPVSCVTVSLDRGFSLHEIFSFPDSHFLRSTGILFLSHTVGPKLG